MPEFAINAEAFSKCAPNIGTNIRQCGTVTQCNAKPVTADELQSLYLKSGDFRVMEALFHHDIEIKMCEAVQNGLYDFFMANKVVTNKNFQTRRTSTGVIEVAPFILARQYSPINNQYWKVTGGTASGATYDWLITVQSLTNIPADTDSFPSKEGAGIGLRVLIHGKSDLGSATETQWEVGAVTDNDDGTVTLDLIDKNAGSFMDADNLSFPVGGLLRRGTPNVNKYEKFCAEMPTYTNWKDVPFWVEDTRYAMCWSSLYQKWKKLVLEGNALYDEFFNLEETQKNKQLGRDWQDRFVYQLFYGKGLQYQTADAYDQLDDITAFDGSPFGLGVDGGRCVGKRASVVGILEQMWQCGRVHDALGAQLNLPALFEEFYNMMRVRDGAQRKNAKSFDVFTDSTTAHLLNQAMLLYYQAESGNMLQLNMPAEGYSTAKKADFGFYYKSYPLFWPQGVTMNVIWHDYFDDFIAAGQAVDMQDSTRVLWVLDFAGIYPGIISSTRKVTKTDPATLAQINANFGCVMEVPTREMTLVHTNLTVIVECPKGNLIIQNFSGDVPEHATQGDFAYPGTHTSTTTTTQTPWEG